MGIFYEQTQVFNRAPVDLTVTFDGQQLTLKPGLNTMAKAAVPFAMNQNPVMGTQDPNNPHITGAEYLIGVPNADPRGEWPSNCEPLTETEWATHLGKPCRLDMDESFNEKYGSDPKAKMVLQGKGRKTTAPGRAQIAEAPKGTAEFTARA